MEKSGFICKSCGQFHEGLRLAFGFEAPAHYYTLKPDEFSERCQLSTDQCIIDQKYYFIRGVLEIPVQGSEDRFEWGVWVSLSETNFKRASELWNTVGREKEPPYFGWLSSALPLYPDTLNLKTIVHTRPVGLRPRIQLESTNHPLAIEQRTGITLERVKEIASKLLHQT
jgi:hypothetical protein